MKMSLGVIVGILLGVLILAAGGILLVKYTTNEISLASNQPSQPASSPLFNSPASTTPLPSAGNNPTISKPVTTPSPATSATTDKVNFNVQITNFAGNGLTRTVSVDITNTGSQDAHNVVGKVEVLSGGKRITIASNGQTSTSQALGTIKAGQTVSTQENLTFSIFDAPALAQNGATVNLIITSDEKTQTITYKY
jgi:hypothetical protein